MIATYYPHDSPKLLEGRKASQDCLNRGRLMIINDKKVG